MKRMKATGPYYWDEVRQGTPQKVPLLGIEHGKERQGNQPGLGSGDQRIIENGDAGRNSLDHRKDESH